jgi:hypothetical protein
MAISDDFDFKTNNCFMASGVQIPTGDASSALKTCSNPKGSGKRFKIVLLQADKSLDLVFNTAQENLEYDSTVVDANGNIIVDGEPTEEPIEESAFRIYRHIMKWATARPPMLPLLQTMVLRRSKEMAFVSRVSACRSAATIRTRPNSHPSRIQSKTMAFWRMASETN